MEPIKFVGQPTDNHLLAEARLRYSDHGLTSVPSEPKFFKAASLLQLLELAPNYIVELTGEIQWLA